MKPITFVASVVFCLASASSASAQLGPDSVVPGQTQFTEKVLVQGLEGPWEITWGPDDYLWVTERTAGRITRINPEDGSRHPAITIEEVSAPGGQDGLLGMALHPDLLKGTGNDYVYTAYTYVDQARGPDPSVKDPQSPYRFLYTKIVRLTYDEGTQQLSDPVDLITGLPASNDHNSGRLKFGPDDRLYYTIGDQGNNQLGNWCIPTEAQRLPTADEISAGNYIAYVGKSLRLNPDGSIPDDNPELDGVRSHVFTYGHRNMQGIDIDAQGTLWASEQGPKTDDEINILRPGGNYGWPHVAGFRDDMAYQYARWAEATSPCEEITFSDITIHPSVPREDETAWEGEMVDPVATMFTVPSDYDFTDPVCEGIDFICWPTVAASSIEIYEPPAGEGIPGWSRSVIVTTLKRGSIYVARIGDDDRSVIQPFQRYFQSENRFRDVAISPDFRSIYVATDPGGLAEKSGGGTTTTMENPGAILVFTYAGEGGAAAGENAGQPAAAQGGDASGAAAPAGDGAADRAAAAGGAGQEQPAGERMPPLFTAEQADRGSTAYNSNCVTCHGAGLSGGTMGPPLSGSFFAGHWGGQPVWALYSYAHDHMPPSRPGSLPEQTYADIVSYILQTNGAEPGDEELLPDREQMDAQIIPAPSDGGVPR